MQPITRSLCNEITVINTLASSLKIQRINNVHYITIFFELDTKLCLLMENLIVTYQDKYFQNVMFKTCTWLLHVTIHLSVNRRSTVFCI